MALSIVRNGILPDLVNSLKSENVRHIASPTDFGKCMPSVC